MVKQLMTFKEAKDFLNSTESWLRDKILKKQIPYIKLGRLIRFNKEALEKWLESKSQQ